MDKPLTVVVVPVLKDDKILLLKRLKPAYEGYWSLVGGKVERDEHVHTAALREVKEETGLTARFGEHHGVVSEHLVEDDAVQHHFVLHVCSAHADSDDVEENEEGTLQWFSLKDIEQMEGQIIPSDFRIITDVVKGDSKGYYSCIIEKQGEDHFLKEFR